MIADTAGIIERLRKATGADREIDVAIWRMVDRPDAPLDRVPLEWLACYTSRIDHALKLVPEGHVWTVATWWCDGTDRPPFYADCASGRIKDGDDVHVHEGRGATPAIALCIAALLAHQAREETRDV